MFLTAVSGIAKELIISAVAPEAKMAVNIIPMVLIPQLVRGGAFIKYEGMNRNLDVERRLGEIDQVIAGGPFDADALPADANCMTAEQLYGNQKITDLVSKAEMEQLDYRLDAGHTGHLDVFSGPVKEDFGIRASVLVFNSGVLVLFSLFGFVVLHYVLRHQLRLRAP